MHCEKKPPAIHLVYVLVGGISQYWRKKPIAIHQIYFRVYAISHWLHVDVIFIVKYIIPYYIVLGVSHSMNIMMYITF